MAQDSYSSPRKLWDPPDPKTTEAYKYMQKTNAKRHTSLQTWEQLHEWSVNNRAAFWDDLLETVTR